MLTELKREAFEANLELPRNGLIHLNFGNASALDRRRGVFAIKPSGVSYGRLRAPDMVLVDLEGRRVEGKLRPSSDTPTHAALYRGFPKAAGIVHTHSLYATAFAQAGRPIPLLGTTHADFFSAEVPVTRPLSKREVAGDYEIETGRVIVNRFSALDPEATPAVLVLHHGPFAWGPTVGKAVENAVAVELCAALAFRTLLAGFSGAADSRPSVGPPFPEKAWREGILRAEMIRLPAAGNKSPGIAENGRALIFSS